MNILLRKLIFNEAEIHLILWKDKPCFLVTELSKALDGVNKEDIPVFLRSGGIALKGVDYDVVAGPDARDLRSYLENSGIKRRFAQTMIIYVEGLKKYLNFRKTIEAKDFMNYLIKSKVSLDDTTPVNLPEEQAAAPVVEKSVPPVPVAQTQVVEKPAAVKTEVKEKKNKGTASIDNYSELLKHISFMEEFVDAFNKLKIAPDKSVAFTKAMVKFLDDKGVSPNEFLDEIKKWIV